VQLHFLTLVLDEYSSTCQVREEFFYDVKGELGSFFLAPCSTTSRSTLGLLTVGVLPPTHTPSGVRIARVSSAVRKYDLAVVVKFGREDYEKPTILLTEVDLLPHDHPEEIGITTLSFDPYAGQVVLKQLHRRSSLNRTSEQIVVDYISP
jgi:hypothetical protein